MAGPNQTDIITKSTVSKTTKDEFVNRLFVVNGKVVPAASASVRLQKVFDYLCGD